MLLGLKTNIRPLEENDIDILYDWYNDQEYNLWSSGAWPQNTLLSREQITERFFDEAEKQRYAILTKNNEMIGTIGFSEINFSARSATLFIGIGDKNHWGKGYGTDALRVFARFLFTQWNFHRLSLDTWDGNTRAIRCYEKVGFQIEGRQREARFILGQYRDSILMGLLQKDFLDTSSNRCLELEDYIVKQS